MATQFSSYNINIDFLNPVVHFNWKLIFERKQNYLTLRKVKSCQENVNIVMALLLIHKLQLNSQVKVDLLLLYKFIDVVQ